jgi:hypothetical protein
VEKPPAWKDEDAVADWVIAKLALPAPVFQRFQELKSRIRLLVREKKLVFSPVAGDATKDVHSNGDSLIVRMDLSSEIDKAVTKAEHGNFESLASLLHPDHPFNNSVDGRTVYAALPPRAWRLIGYCLLGKRQQRKRGRPPIEPWKRLVTVPAHGAAVDFVRINDFLRQNYSEQKTQQIHDRALYIAARHHGIEQNTLGNYLRRSGKDRRRLNLSA